MIIKKYTEYIDELHSHYPKIDVKQLKRIVKTFLHLLTVKVSQNEDFAIKRKGFFLGIISPRTKLAAYKQSWMKNQELKKYRRNRKLNKQYEQQNKNNKHL